MALEPADFALVIGINHYPKYKSLAGPIEDARRIERWLGNQDTGGGVPDLNLRHVLSEQPAGQIRATPVQEDIDDALYYLLDRAKKEHAGQARRFYFYFAGHGLGLDSNEVGLCLPSWSDVFRSNTLMVEPYLRVIQDSGLFKEIFFFLDCCRVRKINAEGHKPNISWPKPADSTGSVQYLIGFASEYQNVAYEAEMQSTGADESQVRGLFTTALIETLESAAAARPEGGVTLAQLCSSVNLRTTELAKAINPNFNQEPRFRIEFRESEKNKVVLGNVQPPEIQENPLGLESFTPPSAAPFRLSVPYPRETEVTVFEENGREAYRGFDDWSGEVLAGTVTVQTNHFGKVDRYRIPHDAPGAQFTVSPPQIFTSTLLAGAVTSHEYLTEPAEYWSRNMTYDQTPGGSDSGLFLFLRQPKREQAQTGLLMEQFELLDKYLQAVCKLRAASSRHDLNDGWHAFSARLGNGQYYLKYGDMPARLIPIYLFQGWQTQLFLLFSGEKPLFETLRIQMSTLGSGFHANDADNRMTDLAHLCLQNINIPFPPEMLKYLLEGKFRNPVFGLLGAYLIFQRQQADLLPQIDVVLNNLRNLLHAPDNPDLAAIGILAKHAKGDADFPIFKHPPMFAFGVEALIRLDLDEKSKVKIPGDSVFQRMADQRQTDLVFTSWETRSGSASNPLAQTLELQPWVTVSLSELLERTRHNKADLSIRDIGLSLRLPEQSVRQALTMLSQDEKTVDMQPDIDQLLKTGKFTAR